MNRIQLSVLSVSLVAFLCGVSISIQAQQKSQKLSFRFAYQGAGSEDQPVRYVMIRRGTEARTASNVLINAINNMRLSFGATNTLAPGTKYTSDYRQLSQQEVRTHNQNNPGKSLPGGVIYGVQYQVSYSIESEQFSIDVSSLLGRKPAGPAPYRRYAGGYAGETFTVPLSKAIEEIFASAIFDRGDILDGRGLARRIAEHKDPVSNYIWAKAGDRQATLQRAANNSNWSNEEWTTLTALLSHIVYDSGFYDQQRFAGLNPNPELRSLMQRRDAYDLPFLNRMLLQSWYSNLVAPSPRFRQLFRTG